MKKAIILLLLFVQTNFLFGQNWQPVTTGVSGNVYCMTEYNNKLIVGGAFPNAGGITVNNIASWDGSNWSNLLNGVSLNGSYANIKSMCVYHNDLYVAGQFDSASGIAVNNIAKWNGTSWSDVGGGVGGQGTFTSITSMAVYNNTLYVTGYFDSAGTIAAAHLAKWNRFVWAPAGDLVGDFLVPNFPIGHALLAANGNLYLGGAFDSIGNVRADGIAEFNGSTWSQVGPGLWCTVEHLNFYNSKLYAGTCSGGLSYYDGFSLQSAGGGLNTFGIAYSSCIFDNKLVVGGNFSSSGSVQNTLNLSYWDGFNWGYVTPPVSGSSGFDSYVYCLTQFNGSLYAGGSFHNEWSFTTPLNSIARYSGPVNVNELSSPNNIGLNPNPASSEITLDANYKGSTINIVDLLGKVAISTTYETGVNISDLKNGIYFLYAFKNGVKSQTRFVVTR